MDQQTTPTLFIWENGEGLNRKSLDEKGQDYKRQNTLLTENKTVRTKNKLHKNK